MNYRRLFVGIVLLGALLVYRPVAVQAAASQEQLDAIGTRVDTCVSLQSSACFSVNPTLPYTYVAVYNDWVNQLRVGRIPSPLSEYVAHYYDRTGQTPAGKVSATLSDLNDWKTAHEVNTGTTGGGTTTGGTGTTPGGVTTTGGGTTTGGTGTTPGGVLISGAKQKPGDFAVKALDTSNFLQDSVSYGWVTDVWQAMRQMSNILIVVFLFLGALATTLNYNLNTYGIKRVLPSVVQAAILANFSYIVMNAAVEAIGLTQKGLLGLGVGGASVNQSTWRTLAAPLGDILTGVQPGSGTGFADIMWGLIVALAVAVAMLMLWLVVGILYIRSFVIAMLVCFAPLAILSMALPATQGLWKKWWDEFLKWLLLPLVVCFWLMVASLVAGVAALPAFLKMAVVMFAVFQGVKAPFSFKPAIAGAAIGYGAAQLTGLGKNVGERALYGNNLTGGVLRGTDRWKQARAASLAASKDSSTIIKGNNTQPPGPNASRWARFKYNAFGNRGRIGRFVNSGFEQMDANVDDAKAMEGVAKTQAQSQAARARNLGSPQTMGQRRASLGLETERAQAGMERQKEDDVVAAAEADPQIMQDIAALNTQKEALSNALESLKTGAKAAALATNESLKVEKKLSEFRKNEAANLLKQVEAGVNQDALNENSPLGNAIKNRLRMDNHLRGALESYGMHIKPDGSGYMEGMMQNELNAVSATEAYESAVKKQQLLIAARDTHRHKKISKIAEKIPNRAVTAADLPSYLEDDSQKVAAAEQLEKQLRIALSSEEFERFGIDSLVNNVRTGVAGSDDQLADAINLYNNKDVVGVATRRGVSVDPAFSDRLESMRRNRIAASLNQGKKVAVDKTEGAKGLSETTAPARRIEMIKEALGRAQADDPTLATVSERDIRVAHVMGANEGYSNPNLKGTIHHDLMTQTTKALRSLREDALKGKNGEPDKDATDTLVAYLNNLQTDLNSYAVGTYGSVARAPAPLQEALANARRLHGEVHGAYTDYVAAHASGNQADINKSQSKLRTTLGDPWFNSIG